MAEITECVREFNEGKNSDKNLLALAVKAAGLRCTLGEISDACEEIVGRYKAVSRVFSALKIPVSLNIGTKRKVALW